MRPGNNILHFAKVIGLLLIVAMIWLTANRPSAPARYSNDQPKATGNFAEGGAEGTWTWWYPNGKKMSEGVFVKGKRNGIWHTWYGHGQKKSEATYKDDKLNGPYTTWHENGKIKSLRHYKDDLLDGAQQYYDTAGILIMEKFYIGGEVATKGKDNNNH